MIILSPDGSPGVSAVRPIAGGQKVQAIAELKSIRDFYVHPTVKKAKYQKIGDDMWDADFGKTNRPGFPREPRKWRRDNAIVAIKSVNDFYNTFFPTWCNLTSEAVVDLLLSSDKGNLKCPQGACIDCIGGLDRAVKEWSIDFKFLGKNI